MVVLILKRISINCIYLTIVQNMEVMSPSMELRAWPDWCLEHIKGLEILCLRNFDTDELSYKYFAKCSISMWYIP